MNTRKLHGCCKLLSLQTERTGKFSRLPLLQWRMSPRGRDLRVYWSMIIHAPYAIGCFDFCVDRSKCMISRPIASFLVDTLFKWFFFYEIDLHAIVAFLSQERTTRRIEIINSKNESAYSVHCFLFMFALHTCTCSCIRLCRSELQ